MMVTCPDARRLSHDRIPWPATSGGPVRTTSQLRIVASLPEVESVTLLSVRETDVPSVHVDGLSHAFDTRVRVEMGQRKGRIVVEFGSADDLARIAGLMGGAIG